MSFCHILRPVQRIFDIIRRFFNQEQKKSAPKEAKGDEGNGSGTQGRQTSLSDEQLEKTA